MPIPKGLGKAAASAVREIIEGITTKASSELPDRMAAPHADFAEGLHTPVAPGSIDHGVGLRGEGIPIADEAMRKAARTTEVKYKPTLAQRVRSGKHMIQGLGRRAPEVPADVRNWEMKMAQEVSSAEAKSHITIKHTMIDLLDPDPVLRKEGAQLLNDYVTARDEVASGMRQMAKSKTTPDKVILSSSKTLAEWNDFLTKTGNMLKKRPDVLKAVKSYDTLVDLTFQDYVDRGIILPERRLDDYFTRQKIGLIQDSMDRIYGEKTATKIGTTLSATLHRDPRSKGPRETNVFRATAKMLERYHKHVAEAEYAGKVLADPAFNKTLAAIQSGTVPPTHVVWAPKPGQAGFGIMAPEAQIINGLTKGLARDAKGMYHGAGYVIPREIAERLDHVRRPAPEGLDKVFFEVGQGVGRWLSVYNPGSLSVNIVSDLHTALAGLPGEKARPLGIMRMMIYGPNGELLPALRAAWAATHGENFNMDVPYKDAAGNTGKRTVNVADMAQTEGLTTAGEAEAFGGMPSSMHFKSIGDVEGMGGPLGVARRVRNTFETMPRIAAGLEAITRTENLSEFGRVGRHSTLNYGHGAPEWSRVPAFRWAAAFTQYPGLAADHLAKSMTHLDSRKRTIALLALYPIALNMWNRQNPAYEEVEESIPSYDRSTLHFIIPGPNNEPLRDPKTGQPIVVGVRVFLTEEVARTFGLGNFASKVENVVKGRTKLYDAITDIPNEFRRGLGQQFTTPRVIGDIAEGKDKNTGKERAFLDATARTIPVVRQTTEVAREAVRSGGDTGRILWKAASQYGGVRVLKTTNRGGNVRDAAMVESQRRLKEANIAIDIAKNNRDPLAFKEAVAEKKAAIEEMRRLSAARRAADRGAKR